MHPDIQIRYEQERGCGYRKPAADGVGIYLVGSDLFLPCPRLPFPLTVCPCCGAGIKFSRGFTWIIPAQLFNPDLEPKPACRVACIMCQPHLAGPRAGLMWVGKQYYTPEQFIIEAQHMGVSKKIPAIPKGFELGRDWVYLAHLKAYYDWDDATEPVKPGVIMAFRPRQIDLVIDDPDRVPDKALALKEQLGDAAHIIVIKQKHEQAALPLFSFTNSNGKEKP